MLAASGTRSTMKKILIWDLPTRLFHWAFTFFLTTSIVLALVAEEGSLWFQWHMLGGLAAAALVILRLASCIAGSRYARFASFPLAPMNVARYFRGVFSGKAERYAGHNPGSALVTVVMFSLVGLLVLTGLSIGGEEMQELHGPVAYALMAVIGLHLAGLVAHTLRHRENIAASMLTGRKMGLPEQGLRSSHPVWGLVFLLIGGAWVAGLYTAHDPRAATTRLPVFRTEIVLGERESHGDRQEGKEHHRRDHDDD